MSFFGTVGGLAKARTTFKPRRNTQENTKSYQLKKYAEATLGSGNLRLAVVLPEGEDLNEWLAINTVDFFNQINMLYGTVTEFCTPQECPVMCAGPRYEYHWQDGVNFKKPTKMSAPEYVDHLMNWTQAQLDDEAVFPSKIGELEQRRSDTRVPQQDSCSILTSPSVLGVAFPKNFVATVKSIVRRLFRVYAHLYNHHFAQLCALSIEAHINTSYRHFLLFVTEFNLIDRKELAPLSELNESIMASS
ncbi:BQ5605_C014g07499 [Microbotryum silenes-dioicae]|uniref:BQ5605_C014g07499 protein n=1 Tax=Microbotryum silenes-dioicae TaxID=796604 RepID=A0A2X0MNG7_9BASI|nr:BQ5605_C014g07499 [Microbotryum silenes-dioicae]